jgi:L-lysine 6-transaminase
MYKNKAIFTKRFTKSSRKISSIDFQCKRKGLMCAFDLPTGEIRKDFQEKLYEENVIILICGDCSLRFRPHLNVHKKICNLH